MLHCTNTGCAVDLTLPCSTVLSCTLQYCAVYSTVKYSTLLCSILPYCAVFYLTVQYSTLLCSTLQYCVLYPDWPHRQCVGLAFRRSHDRGSLSAVRFVICSPARIAVCNTWSSGGTALCRVGGATSQLDLSSLTPLSVAGCG